MIDLISSNVAVHSCNCCFASRLCAPYKWHTRRDEKTAKQIRTYNTLQTKSIQKVILRHTWWFMSQQVNEVSRRFKSFQKMRSHRMCPSRTFGEHTSHDELRNPFYLNLSKPKQFVIHWNIGWNLNSEHSQVGNATQYAYKSYNWDLWCEFVRTVVVFLWNGHIQF